MIEKVYEIDPSWNPKIFIYFFFVKIPQNDKISTHVFVSYGIQSDQKIEQKFAQYL
jgi:hypothetical protein